MRQERWAAEEEAKPKWVRMATDVVGDYQPLNFSDWGCEVKGKRGFNVADQSAFVTWLLANGYSNTKMVGVFEDADPYRKGSPVVGYDDPPNLFARYDADNNRISGLVKLWTTGSMTYGSSARVVCEDAALLTWVTDRSKRMYFEDKERHEFKIALASAKKQAKVKP